MKAKGRGEEIGAGDAGVAGYHPVIRAWFEARFGAPTGVQTQAWRHIRAGEHTLIASPTGSGKTLAALLPCLDALVKGKLADEAARTSGVRVLYVTPLKALNNDIQHHVVRFAEEMAAVAAGLEAGGEADNENGADGWSGNGYPGRGWSQDGGKGGSNYSGENSAEGLDGGSGGLWDDGKDRSDDGRHGENVGGKSRGDNERQDENVGGKSRIAPAPEEMRWPGITVGVRTGDTPQSTRSSMLRRPPDVLVTTPESLYLLLTSPRARDMLRTVEHLIVDEIHDVVADKRGMHLSLTLERLVEWCGRAPQRIGVSATQKPIERVARFLGGWDDDGRPRPVRIVEHRGEKRYELRVGLPEPLGGAAASAEDAVWTPLVKRVLGLMESEGARTTLVFVNSRRLSERLTQRLNEEAGAEAARAHHGSVAREQRLEVESLLKEGRLRCLVATSSLELGIDVGHVDLVIQIDAPASAAAALQRIGRAGHAAGAVSRAVLLARSRGGLAQLAALARRVVARDIESLRIPRHGLDVLAQQIVAMLAAGDDWDVARLERLLARSDSYRGLPRERLTATLDMLAGHFPFVRPFFEWDRASGRLTKLAAAPMAAILGAGTIPQSTAYPVHHHETGIHLGELDEEYIHESQVGDVFQLGASSWRIQRIRPDRVYVTETANRFSEIPFWRGEGAGRSLELSRDVGRIWRELEERLLDDAGADKAPAAASAGDARASDTVFAAPEAARTAADQAAIEWLAAECRFEPEAAVQLIRLARSQRAHTPLPSDRTIVLEQFADEQNRVHFVLHSLFGRTVNRTWQLAIERKLQRLGIVPAHAIAKDNGLELVFTVGERVQAAREAIVALHSDEAQELVLEAASGSSYFAAAFRELAQTSLLLSRSFTRVPAFVMRLRTEELMKDALPFKDRFPLFAEALRVCMEQKLDLPGLQEVLGGLQTGDIRWCIHESSVPSPMTTQYQFDYVNANMYESDAVPRDVQLELVGISRELAEAAFGPSAGPPIDPVVLAEERRAAAEPPALRQPGDVVRLLKERGDHTREELLALLDGDEQQLDEWLRQLIAERAAAVAELAQGIGSAYVCGDEADLYATLPHDAGAAMFILKRYADSRFSFTIHDVLQRYPLPAPQADAWIDEAVRLDLIQRAPFAHGEEERIWMSSKAASRLVRLSIRTFRAAREGLGGERYAAKLLSLHGIGAAASGDDPIAVLKEAIRGLQGWFAPIGQWEATLLPARLPGYRKEHLDLLCASGEVLWIGRKKEGEKEGSVAFFLTEDRELYAPYSQRTQTGPESARPELLRLLQARGASFLTKLSLDSGLAPSALLAQLLELVWEGRVSNDQFAPLREYAQGGAGKADKFRSGLGRWYVLTEQNANVVGLAAEQGLHAEPGLQRPDMPSAGSGAAPAAPQPGPAAAAAAGRHPSAEASLHEASALRWARHLLDSYGIVSKPLVAALCPYSWDTMSGVLKQLEMLGHVARGLFVKELESIQFASAGLLAELAEPSRKAQTSGGAEPFTLLSAADPANAYGWLLPWPALGKSAGFARKIGNWLVWSGGEWTLWLENGARRIATLKCAAGPQRTATDEMKRILHMCLKRQGLRKIVIDSWNGTPIAEAPEGAALQALGAERDRASYVLWPSQLA